MPHRQSLENIQTNQRGETPHSIAIIPAANFLLPFSAQKSHVKSQNGLNCTNETRSSWHFSYAPPAILKIVEKNETSPAGIDSPGLTLLERRF
jgi:hypothetical protein